MGDLLRIESISIMIMSLHLFMDLLKILLTIYMKRIYNTNEGQKHFVLCDETPAFCHFFCAKSLACSFLGNNINTYIIGEGENNIPSKEDKKYE